MLTEKLLFNAVKKGDIKTIEECLDAGVNVNCNDVTQVDMSPLSYALLYRQKDAVELLLARGADLDVVDSNGWTILQQAVFTSTPEIVNLLTQELSFESAGFKLAYEGDLQSLQAWVANNENVNTLRDSLNNGLLHYAAAGGQTEAVSWLLKCEIASITEKNNSIDRALRLAVRNGHLPLVQWFLSEGMAFFDKRYRAGSDTVLLLAARNGHMSLVQWLLTAGNSFINEENANGNTALLLAAMRAHLPLVQWLLLEGGASIDEKDNVGSTALLLAAEEGDLSLVQWLLTEGGASIDEKARHGGTALLLAAWGGHLSLAKWLLLEGGASIDDKDKDGNTALLLAAREGHFSLVKWLLLEGGASIDDKDKDGNTALLLAAREGHFSLVKWLLLEGGASIDDKDKDGNTVLLLAPTEGDFSLVKWLLAEGGASIDEKNRDGDTIPLLAAKQRHLSLVQWLVARDMTKKLTGYGFDELLADAKQREQYYQSYLRLTTEQREALKLKLSYSDETHCLFRAARGGLPVAQIEYAKLCITNSDGETALTYLSHALYHKERPAACHYLSGTVYEQGIGTIDTDVFQAEACYQRAANLGSEIAKTRLQALSAQLREARFNILLKKSKAQQVTRAREFTARKQVLQDKLQSLLLKEDKGYSPLLADVWMAVIQLGSIQRTCKKALPRKLEPTKIAAPGYLLSLANEEILKNPIKRKANVVKPLVQAIKKLQRYRKVVPKSDYKTKVEDALDQLINGYQNYLDILCAAKTVAERRFWAKTPALLMSSEFGSRCMTLSASKNLGVLQERINQQFGGSIVKAYSGAHYKLNPYAPGIEFMVSSLGQVLAGQGATPSTLLKIIGANGHPNTYQASLTVLGTELEKIIKDRPDYLEKIRPDNFSAVAVLGMLVDPRDGKPENYMVELTLDDEGQVVSLEILGVDNDLAFVDVAIMKHQGQEKKYFINIKNVIYFFPQMMHSVASAFKAQLAERHPAELLLEWFEGVYQQNESYRKLLDDGVFTEGQFSGGSIGKRGLQLPIRLVPGTLRKLYYKLSHLLDAIKTEGITHWELLEQLEPAVAHHYAAVKHRYPNDIMGAIEAIYEENITDWRELKYFREQLEAGNTRVMTARVLKTIEEYGLEDERTQEEPEMFLEILANLPFAEYGAATAQLIYPILSRLSNALFKKPLLFLCAEKGYEDLVLFVLKNNLADINEQNTQGCTALYIAASRGDLSMVQMLVAQDADSKLANDLCKTPEDAARQKRHDSIVSWFENRSLKKSTIGERIKKGEAEESIARNPLRFQIAAHRAFSSHLWTLQFQHNQAHDKEEDEKMVALKSCR